MRPGGIRPLQRPAPRPLLPKLYAARGPSSPARPPCTPTIVEPRCRVQKQCVRIDTRSIGSLHGKTAGLPRLGAPRGRVTSSEHKRDTSGPTGVPCLPCGLGASRAWSAGSDVLGSLAKPAPHEMHTSARLSCGNNQITFYLPARGGSRDLAYEARQGRVDGAPTTRPGPFVAVLPQTRPWSAGMNSSKTTSSTRVLRKALHGFNGSSALRWLCTT